MFPLGALIAGDPAGAYRQGQQQIQQLDLNQLNLQNAQEDQLAGNLLGSAFQGLVPGASPMPGGPAQPPQAQNPLQMMLQRFRALGAPQQPPMQMGAPQQPPMQMGPSPQASMGPPAPSGGMPPPPGPASFSDRFGEWQTGGMPSARPVGPSVMAASGPGWSPSTPMGGPPGGAAPGGAGAAGAAAPSPMPGAGAPPVGAMARAGGMGQNDAGQQGHPGLTWQQVMQAIVQRAPPGMPPRIIAKAVNGAIPLMNSQSQAEWREIQGQLRGLTAENQALRTNMLGQRWGLTGPGGGQGGSAVGEIVKGVTRGDIAPNQIPPAMRPQVESQLAQQGFNLAKAQTEWNSAQQQVRVANSPATQRFVQVAKTIGPTIDRVLELADQMKLGGITPMNELELKSYIKLVGNSPEGQLAARYLSEVTTLKEEFASAVRGGYAPTEEAFKLAYQQVNETYGYQEIRASLEELRRAVQYRINAIPNLGTLGPGSPNQYLPQGGGQLQPTAPGAVPGAAPAATPKADDPLGIR